MMDCLFDQVFWLFAAPGLVIGSALLLGWAMGTLFLRGMEGER